MIPVHAIQQLEMEKKKEKKIVGAVIESAFVHIFQGWAATILLDVSQHRATIIYCSIVIVKNSCELARFPGISAPCYLARPVLTGWNNSKRSWLYRKIGKRKRRGVFLQTKFHFPISLFSGPRRGADTTVYLTLSREKIEKNSSTNPNNRCGNLNGIVSSFPSLLIDLLYYFWKRKYARIYFGSGNPRWKLGKRENRANLTRN